jgi:hypothetical protein
MLQWIQNNIQLLIPVLFFGFSGLGWLLKKLQEASEKKRVDEARKRARLEALRTGRIDGQQPAPQPAGARPAARAEAPRKSLEDLARRRQEDVRQRTAAQRTELEEQLRRRREAIEAQRLRQQQQRQPAPPRVPAQQPSRPQAPRPASRQTVSPQQPARRPGERRPVSALPTMQPIQQTVIADVIEAKREAEERPMEAPLPVAGLGPRKVPITARGIDLRQAVIMREIFDRPVALRDPVDPGW